MKQSNFTSIIKFLFPLFIIIKAIYIILKINIKIPINPVIRKICMILVGTLFVFTIGCNSIDNETGSLLLNMSISEDYKSNSEMKVSSYNLELSGPKNDNINKETDTNGVVTIDDLTAGIWRIKATADNKNIGSKETSVEIKPKKVTLCNIIFNPDNTDDLTNNGNDANSPVIFNITGYGDFLKTNYSEVQNHVYYLSGTGNDTTGDGSSGNPWKSITKVQAIMLPGDTIILRNGNYGLFSETAPANRTDWITFKAEAGHIPIFSRIYISYGSTSNAYLRFDGIEISVAGSATNFDVGVNLEYVQNFELRNCDIHNNVLTNKYYTDYAVRTLNCSNILIYHNHMHSLQTANVILGSSNITIYKNHMHHLGGGDGVRWAAKSSNGIIERNNIYDSLYSTNDEGAPTEIPHSCAIEVRANNVLIRKNICHGIGNTAGLRMYPIDASGGESAYCNIVIENNLFYDLQNTDIIVENLGNNVVISNNTLIGRLRIDTNYGAAKLYIGISVVSIANGYDGSGLSVYNNIIAGIGFSFPTTAKVFNNIFWAFSYNNAPFTYLLNFQNNTVITWGTHYPITYFASGFFNGLTSGSETYFSINHGLTLDYTLTTESPAINYGDSANQPTDSLGSIDGNGYISDNGQIRDALHHSAGCYEL